MKPLQSFKWSDHLYDVSVVLLWGDGRQALRWMDKTFENVSGGECGEFTGAKTVWIERPKGCAIALWFPQWFHVNDAHYLGVLAHECFHAAEFVLGHRGMALTDASSEAYAYYIAWMFRNVYQKLTAKKF